MRLALAVVAFLALSCAASTQTSNGTLVGSVTDQTGAVVPNVDVKATSPEFGQVFEAKTDAAGTYRIEGLQPGTYNVVFTSAGLAALRVGSVVISGSVTTTVNGQMELGSVQTTVTVEAGAGQIIDTQSGQIGESLGQEEIANLPIGSLNPAELAMTLPGVQDVPSNGSVTNGVGFSVNGTRPRANNFLIDGQDNNDYGISGQAFQPNNVGAIQEVSILTNTYNAEYGRGGGSVTNYIYKSGTNSFHGDAWEINRNSAFAAIPAQNKFAGSTSNPLDNENTFGFDFGGPAIKDKLFFFGTAQWDRERQRQSGVPTNANGNLFSLPTAAGITTLKSLLPNPNVSLLLASLGGLTAPEDASGNGLVSPTCVPLGNGRPCVQSGVFQLVNIPVVSNGVQWNARADWHLGPNDTLTGSYIRSTSVLNPDYFANPGALPQFQTQQGGPSQLFRGQWIHIVSTKLLNEIRFSYTNIDFSFSQTPATLAGPLANIPEIDFQPDTNYPSLGVDSGTPQARAHKTSQFQEALTYNIGQHTIKGGVDVTFLTVRDEIPFNSRGVLSYFFNGGFSFLANYVDDFTGFAASVLKVIYNPIVSPSVTMYMPYIQDTWRIKENLTLNLGLRYEYWGTVENGLPFPAIKYSLGFGVPGAVFPDVYSFAQQPDRNNFAPRIGVAYTPRWGGWLGGHGLTVIRAGFGVFYDGLFTNIVDNTAASVPNVNGGTVTGGAGRGAANSMSLLAGITPTLDPTATVDTIANTLHNPVTYQYNFNIERELPGRFVLTLAYVGSKGESLFANQDLNGGTGNFDAFGNIIRLNPNFGEIAARTNAGESSYNSGQIQVERKFYKDLTLRGAYTYAKYLDDASEIFITTGGSSYSQNLQCQKCDWGASTFDRRHRFNFVYVWDLPYSHSNWLTKALTDRWQWAGNTTFETGTPQNVYDGFDNNGDGHSNDRPNYGNRSRPVTLRGIDGADLFPIPPGTAFFDIDQCFLAAVPVCNPQPATAFHFVIPFSGFGNVRRDSVYGPGQIYFDTSIQRTFPIPMGQLEHQSIMFRAEFFNAFNHPNLFTPTFNMLSAQYTQTAPTINGGREIRFWLMYSF